MKGIVNSHLPFASELGVGTHWCNTLRPCEMNHAGVMIPTSITISDAHYAALVGLDAADHRRVRLAMFNVVDMPLGPDGAPTQAAKDALKAALQGWKAR